MKKIISRENGTKKVVTVNDEPTRTQQQWKDSVDVNNIMKKYNKTGTITHLRNAQNGVYMDLTEIPDYMSSLLQIQKAKDAFSELPALVREKFQHDPSQLIDYLKDPKNHDEAVKLGLLIKRDEPKPKTNDATSPVPLSTPPQQT